MLELAKKLIYAIYDSKEPRGVFFSVFDKNWTLVLSNWVIQSDKTLDTTMDTLYHGIVEKQLVAWSTLVVDIVTNVKQETNMSAVMNVSLKDNGIFLHTIDATKSAVLLPHTAGITDIKQALMTLQKKFSMVGNVNIYVFQAERFVIE